MTPVSRQFIFWMLYAGASLGAVRASTSTAPAGHPVPCDGAPAPEGKQCCGKTPFNPKLVTTSEDKEEDVNLFGSAAGAAEVFLGASGNLTKLKYKETTTVGKVCCGGDRLIDYRYFKREGSDSAGVKFDILKSPAAQQIRAGLERASAAISKLVNKNYEFTIEGSAPGELTYGGSGSSSRESGCDGVVCAGYWTTTATVGLTGATLTVTGKEKVPGAVEKTWGSLVVAGSVTSSSTQTMGTDCNPVLPTQSTNSGCLRLALKIDFFSIDWDIVSIGEFP